MQASLPSLAALSLLLGSPAIAEEWQLISRSPQGEAIYVDVDSIRQAPQTVTANHYLSSTQTVSRFQVVAHDCRLSQYRVLDTRASQTAPPAWQPVQPNSPLAAVHNRLCAALQANPGQPGLVSLQ